MTKTAEQTNIIDCTTEIVAAYVSNNTVPVGELNALIQGVHQALSELGTRTAEPEPLVPAVPVKKSVTRDYIVCLEDGKRFKTLKRHLAVHYGLTPQEYREKWNLPADYPMAAPSYSESRSALAKALGLGQKSKAAAPAKASRSKGTAKAAAPAKARKAAPRTRRTAAKA